MTLTAVKVVACFLVFVGAGLGVTWLLLCHAASDMRGDSYDGEDHR